MSQVSWLHLSDVHCLKRNGWDFDPVVDALERDLQQMAKSNLPQPDAVFVTGDLAYGHLKKTGHQSLPAQFKLFDQFLTRVRRCFSPEIPKDRVFLVPGNHDIDRTKATQPLNDWAKNARAEEVTSMMAHASHEWEQFAARLWAYAKFLKQEGYSHLIQDRLRHIYGVVLNIRDIKVGIAGFNSAWSCCRDGEKGSLRIGGDWQVSDLFNRVRDADLRIALIHHPERWFAESEETSFFRGLRKQFHLCLHGHEHENWIQRVPPTHLTISASACYDHSVKQSGYNFATVDVSKGVATVRFRAFDRTGREWGPRFIGGITEDDGTATIGFADKQPGEISRLKVASTLPGHTNENVPPALTTLHPHASDTDEEPARRQLGGDWQTSYQYENSDGSLRNFSDIVCLEAAKDEVHGKNKQGVAHSYKLRGTLRDNNWFVGTWRSNKDGNVHHGAFMLYISPSGREMHGKWLGIDGTTEVLAGEWEWKKLDNPMNEPTPVVASSSPSLPPS